MEGDEGIENESVHENGEELVGGAEEEENEDEGEEGWWEGEEAKTLEEEARDKNITDLFNPDLLGELSTHTHQ